LLKQRLIPGVGYAEGLHRYRETPKPPTFKNKRTYGIRSCLLCPNQFKATGPSQRVCVDCTGNYRKIRKAEVNNNKPEHRHCEECGDAFSTTVPHQRFCCRKHMRRAQLRARTSRRRAVTRGALAVEKFSHSEIFERDKYRCQLCGVKTRKKKRGTIDLLAPELDHIIPLSCGGQHVRTNVQCACYKCNQKKKAAPLGQLRMFG
jgi:5-methylcytosine-specific restriction endonuclease McrA